MAPITPEQAVYPSLPLPVEKKKYPILLVKFILALFPKN
jgi:hypothetical protein